MKRFPRPRRPIFIVLFILALLISAAVPVVLTYLNRYPHIPTYGLMGYAFGVPVDYQTCGFHTGQDWFGSTGTPIYAIEDGIVLYVGPLWFAGPDVGRGAYSIILYHEAGDYYTTYGHNSVALVNEGDTVERGQKIAEMGNEGYSGSPHLHLEKVITPFTGNWQEPFIGCEGYVEPGTSWDPW